MSKNSISKTSKDEYPKITQADFDRAVLRKGLDPSEGKQRITIMLDAGVIGYFKSKAGKRGYQTLINEALKNVIDSDITESSNMTNTNIFKNKYSVAEDKLTYYFLAMLDLLDDETQKQFFEKIFNYNLTCKPLTDISFQKGGDNSRIDASFSLECVDGKKKIIHLENKTYTCALTVEQLNNHKNFYCKNNGELLVISPRHDDADIAKRAAIPGRRSLAV